MPTIYEAWGFTENPFTTVPLQPDERGEKLLIGRDDELDKLCRRIENAPRIPTLEGAIGIGKTSLINVAAYHLFRTHLANRQGPLFIPCRKTFQLNSSVNVSGFINDFVKEVAQALIMSSQLAKPLNSGLVNKTAIDKWLNSPTFKTVEGGLQVLAAGISGGMSTTENTGQGFEQSGFKKLVFDWLSNIFSHSGGGVVCIIDNMELLQESSAARQTIEALRDELLLVPGLRWVLCGANGIIQSVVASPRLQGILYTPIELTGITDDFIPDILTSRIATYTKSRDPGYLPITPESFDKLYVILNRNLRNLLSFADDYCLWIADSAIHPESDTEKKSAFNAWIIGTAKSANEAVATQLRPRAWEIFDRAVELGGTFSPSDFELFGCASIPALRPQIRDLEAVGLLQSSRDDTDQRRKSITVTSKGYLVSFYRNSVR